MSLKKKNHGGINLLDIQARGLALWHIATYYARILGTIHIWAAPLPLQLLDNDLEKEVENDSSFGALFQLVGDQNKTPD